MKDYDAQRQPDPDDWLSLEETEQLSLILEYHERLGDVPPNPQIHAVFHTIIENQVAMGDALQVRQTLKRLMTEGLDRHEAIHAIGAVLADDIFDTLKGDKSDEFDVDDYEEKLSELSAESWQDTD